MFRILTVALLIVVGVAWESRAQGFATVESLLAACEFYEKPSLSVVDAVNFEQCRSFIAGFYDGWTSGRLYIKVETKIVSTKDTDICFPPTAQFTHKQLARIFIKWAKDNPSKHHQSGWSGVRSAFGHAFPCTR